MLSWYWQRREKKSKGKTSKKLDKEWITVGHIPDAFTVGDWHTMGRIVTQTSGRAFQTLGRAFYFLLRLQNLGWVFGKLGRALERLGCAC